MGGKVRILVDEDLLFEMAREVQALHLQNLELKRQLAESRKQVKDAAGFLYARSMQMEKKAVIKQ